MKIHLIHFSISPNQREKKRKRKTYQNLVQHSRTFKKLKSVTISFMKCNKRINIFINRSKIIIIYINDTHCDQKMPENYLNILI